MKNSIIIAPHADDELIGCYKIIATNQVFAVLFGSYEAMKAGEECAHHFKHNIGTVSKDLAEFEKTGRTFYFPDPSTELHPLHRELGSVGEKLLRNGEDVIFYTTNMNVPYMFEVPFSKTKLTILNMFYKDKKSLWEYDHKYFLFEGYNQWIL